MVINVNKSSSVKISDFLLAIRYYELDFLCQTVKDKLFFLTWFDKKMPLYSLQKWSNYLFYNNDKWWKDFFLNRKDILNWSFLLLSLLEYSCFFKHQHTYQSSSAGNTWVRVSVWRLGNSSSSWLWRGTSPGNNWTPSSHTSVSLLSHQPPRGRYL